MTNQKSLLKPSIELILAGIFWGFGFTATVWALPFLSPAAIVAYRFLAAFAVGILFFPWVNWKKISFRQELKYSIFAGATLGLCLFLQTWGLESTSAINSSFITTLYVVLVPFIARIFLSEKLHPLHWLCIALALAGTALIIQLNSIQIKLGDLLTLACAAIASIQIVYIGWIGDKSKSSFVLNSLQNFWAGIPFLLVLFSGKGHWNLMLLDQKAWIGMISLTFGSTVIAFFLQLKAQKEMSPSLASLFFLLESPFSLVFAVLLLKENVTGLQLLGGLTIILACFLAIILENKRRLKVIRRVA